MKTLVEYLISFKEEADKLIAFPKIFESSFKQLSSWDKEDIDTNFDSAIRLSYNLENVSSIDIFDKARTAIYDSFLVYISILYESYSINDAALREKIVNLKDAVTIFNSHIDTIKENALRKAPSVVVEKHIIGIDFSLLLKEALDLKVYRKSMYIA